VASAANIPALALQVEQYLRQNRTQWRPLWQIGAATGIRRYNDVMQAIAYIRDNIPQEPLVSSNQGARFTQDWNLIRPFARWRIRTATTVLRRLRSGVIIPLIALSPSPDLRRLDRNMERLVEDLDDVLVLI